MSLVSRSFATRAHAENAVRELVQAGFAPEAITLLATEPRAVVAAPPRPAGAHRLAALVAAAGGAFGALAGGVASAGAVTTPEAPLLASGPLVLALSGFAAGAAAGGLIGALAAGGVGDRSATFMTGSVEDRLVASVFVQDDRDLLARSVLDTCGAEPIGRE